MADASNIDRQVSLPFSFGPDGTLSTTTNLAKQMEDHVFCAVGTQQGERVMSSGYGTVIVPYLFSAIDDQSEQEITQQVSAALLANAPEVLLQGVDYVTVPTGGSMDLNVRYTLANSSGDVSTATVPVQLGSVD